MMAHSVHALTRRLRPIASRDGVAVVYLLRSTEYQFCNCGVLLVMQVDGRLALNQTFGITEGNMAKKAKKAKKTAKKTAKKKKK